LDENGNMKVIKNLPGVLCPRRHGFTIERNLNLKWGYPSYQCVEHRKYGVFGRTMSIDAFLRVWKHKMHCNNEN
jgi:hypothetical protein